MPEGLRLGQIGDVADLLAISRSRADQLSRHVGFPEPIGRMSGGRVWDLDHVEDWAVEVGRLDP